MRAAALGQQMDEMDVLTCYAQGWPEPYIHTVYDRMYRVGQNRLGIYTVYAHLMYGDFPAKNAVCTPYIPINVWFWPTLCMCAMRMAVGARGAAEGMYECEYGGDGQGVYLGLARTIHL